ncbi:DUF1396 domain-containing protein [Streptomyces sp. NPDC002018]|uniref:DUF1396 domain-containing protein n=1 Tax=Streptomyces sp. NPDC002018 TaxID=3364629 RepID=UPI0036942DF5
MKHRTIAAAALAGALLCGTAACSSGTEGAKPAAEGKASGTPVEMSPVAAVKKAAANNEKFTSVTYTMKGSVPGEGVVEGDASMSLKPIAVQMKMRGELEGKQQEVELRLTSDGMYLNGGKEAAAEMDGKSWLKFPMEALGAGGESPLGALTGQVDKNPAAESGTLTAAKDLKKVGEETVGGVRTTRYTGTLTLEQMGAALGKGAGAEEKREKTLKTYRDMGIDRLTMDMWIDGEDRTKQFRTRGESKKGPLDMTITFVDFNKPVVVKAPPASETVDLAEMMAGAQAG